MDTTFDQKLDKALRKIDEEDLALKRVDQEYEPVRELNKQMANNAWVDRNPRLAKLLRRKRKGAKSMKHKPEPESESDL